MASAAEHVRIDGDAVTLVFALVKGGAADLVYLGARLPEGEDLTALSTAARRSRHESQPDVPPVPGLLPERKGGWGGTPAIALNANGAAIETDFRLKRWHPEPQNLSLTYEDARLDLSIEQNWEVTDTGMICAGASITHYPTRDLRLDRLSAIALPIPHRFEKLISFSGRWASEMHEMRQSIAPNGFARHSAIGKPGFGGGNWLILEDATTGEVLGAHLGWAGDYDTRIECDNAGNADGRAMLQMSGRLDGGEIDLGEGSYHQTPHVVLAIAPDRSALAQRFHNHLRSDVLPDRRNWPARKVHLNSWEALGFNLSEPDLFSLVGSAKELGVERFVLDDGWFGAKGQRRRNDRTSLGDWFASSDVFPGGLSPLIDHVRAKGMDFGLWVEPEMVSPESELYRAHPDWCLHLSGIERDTMRHQLVLNLTKPEVSTYIFNTLDGLLRDHEIAYLKWDHNRDLFPAASDLGSVRWLQTEAFHNLLDKLRAMHPHVEIETCSSGGGRIDTRTLGQTHRVWPSDNNDPTERTRIMRAWSQFLPLEVLGNHVGPSPNPITGRRTGMDFRAKVALFGHMGVEADPRVMNEDERGVLKAHIALYKEWRGLLHSGRHWMLNHPDPGIFAQMVVGCEQALAVAAQTQFARDFDSSPVRLAGLDPVAQYRVTLPRPWPDKGSLYLPDWQRWSDGFTLSGRALMTQGLALPLTHPETAWLIALEKL